MQHKRVLILTDAFPPAFAPRMGYLAKYLEGYGWTGVALAPLYDREQNTFEFLSGHIPFESIVISKPEETTRYKKNLFQKALSFFLPDLRSPWKLNKEIEQKGKVIIEKEGIDIILCSTYKLFPLTLAYKFAKIYGIPWVADLRDIDEQYPIQGSFLMKLYNKIGIRRRNFLLKRATAVTVVSKKHVEIISKYNTKTSLIYNGFDSDLFKQSEYHKLDKFRIVYTGILSTQSVGRDPSSLFSVIQKLSANNKINSENCRIQFFSNSESHNIVKKLADKYRVTDFVDYFGYISSAEVPKVLDDSSVLLLLNQGNTGIMTTKLFEYLAVGRPILCIWSDEGPIEELIIKTRTGIAVTTEEEIYSFIQTKYNEWQTTGYTNSSVDNEYIMQFSRKGQARQFTDLLNSLLSRCSQN